MQLDSVMELYRVFSALHRKDIFWHRAATLIQSGERIPEMYFWFTAELRDFETNIADQTLLSVMAVRMWSYLTLNLTKCKSFTTPLTVFKCWNQTVLVADVWRCKFKQEKQSKASEQHQTLLNILEWKWQKKDIVHIKTCKATKWVLFNI